MTNLGNRPALGLRPAKAIPNPAYLAAVRQCPCIICESFGEVQTTQTEAHHPICGRFSSAKVPDEMAIPTCIGHHRGGEPGRTAIHQNKTLWVAKYGNDFDYVPMIQDRLAHLLTPATPREE